MSAAERAGLQRGDIIIEFGGEKVQTADELNELKAKHSSGDVVSIKVDRNGTIVELNILLPQPTEVETIEK
jgi:serine protease Do